MIITIIIRIIKSDRSIHKSTKSLVLSLNYISGFSIYRPLFFEMCLLYEENNLI